MSEQVGQGRQPTTRSLTRMKWLPFWVLQATEIVVALVFVDISIHVANGGILVVAALLLVAAAVTAHGPLGFFRVVG